MEIIKPSFVEMGVSERIYIGFATLNQIKIEIEFSTEGKKMPKNVATHIRITCISL